MISVATIAHQATVLPTDRLRREYLTRRLQSRTLSQRLIVRIVVDELADRAGAS